MAQALRAVCLEPEEQQEAAPIRLSSRPRASHPATAGRRAGIVMALIAATVVGCMLYTGIQARIAHNEMCRQQLRAELARLQRENVQLRLQYEGLSTQQSLLQVAQQQGLALPTADRVHYVRVTNALPLVTARQAAPAPLSWAARSGRILIAALDSALHRLGRGPGEPVYAHP